jgi:hypothetical protein
VAAGAKDARQLDKGARTKCGAAGTCGPTSSAFVGPIADAGIRVFHFSGRPSGHIGFEIRARIE